MVIRIYEGRPGTRRDKAAAGLSPAPRLAHERPEGYLADEGLIDAVNVALLLGRPLLLTGEPGTGKTQFASSLAWELGLGEPLIFGTKSTSTAGDLFYTYNALGRFHAAQVGEGSRRGLDYLTYNALGLAILLAQPAEAVRHLLPEGFAHGGRRRSVVPIDEVDKAPRDFPNDILNEVEGMYFHIPELGGVEVRADPAWRPILVLTSNSEKDLPDGFLRRCIYYNIPFPDHERLMRIVAARLGPFEGRDGRFLTDALDLFERLRDPTAGLRKRPATAELLDWLEALDHTTPRDGNPLDGPPEQVAGLVARTASALVKTADDHERVREIVRRWTETHRL